jgi:hypothetical protein
MMIVGNLIELLVIIIVGGLVVSLVLYGIRQMALPPAFEKASILVVILVAVLVLLGLIGIVPRAW